MPLTYKYISLRILRLRNFLARTIGSESDPQCLPPYILPCTTPKLRLKQHRKNSLIRKLLTLALSVSCNFSNYFNCKIK